MNIALSLLSDMALIAMSAYIIGRNQYIIACINNPGRLKHGLTLTAIFSLLSILGTYNGIPVEGALANTRLVGVLMSGIMGGPTVGISVGAISGLHRYLLGGFTAETCGVAALLGGLFAGLIRQKTGLHHMTWKSAALIALIAEIAQKSMVLIFSKPFEAAWALEKAIAIPTTAVTVLGTLVFMLIIKDIHSQQEAASAKYAELSLQIANLTLPYLRHGLNSSSATATAEIIHRLTKVDAVSITNETHLLSFIGKGSDHHQNNGQIVTRSTQDAIADNKIAIIQHHEEDGCPVPHCPLKSAVIAPLSVRGKAVGSIRLSLTKRGEISESLVKIAGGIADILSGQIELAEIDEQRKMREKAELKALRAQINPHFLFNTINIIMSLCRTAPTTARDLLAHLANILHHSFDKHGDFVSIEEELEVINSYLEIAKARFGSRLTIISNIDSTALPVLIPILSIQPLVENAIRHGLFPKIEDCSLTISVARNPDYIEINVIDNGIGISNDNIARILNSETDGVGIQNVNKRLRAIYGDEWGLKIDSRPDCGTAMQIRIPPEGGISYAC